jgi:hypothetical protein
MPELTAFDVVTHLIAAGVYLAVGLAALGQAPRDERTRVFAALGGMHAIGFGIPVAAWFLGEQDPLAFNRVPLAVMLSALSIGALLMFHFSQVFPRRRPWIAGAGPQLPLAYLLTPIVVFTLVNWWPSAPAQVTPKFGLVFIVFGFPLMVLLGLVLPIASIVSLLRSLRETAAPTPPAPHRVDSSRARIPLSGIILSQLAGGALSILVLGPLAAVAPESPAVVVVGVTVWLLGMLTPLAYAAGIWKYGVLAIGQPPSAEVEPD